MNGVGRGAGIGGGAGGVSKTHKRESPQQERSRGAGGAHTCGVHTVSDSK